MTPLKLAQASAAAYTQVPTIEIDNVQVLLIPYLRKEVIVSFRGTNEPKDIISNVSAELVTRPGCLGKVHQGFYRDEEKVSRAILEAVSGARVIHVTGHSLGGALATLFAQRLSDSGYPVGQVATFGAPRCGDSRYRKFYSVEIQRYANDGDLVPLLPPAHWGYRHVCPPVRGQSLSRQWWDLIRGWVGDIGVEGVAGLKAHRMREYLMRVEGGHSGRY